MFNNLVLKKICGRGRK